MKRLIFRTFTSEEQGLCTRVRVFSASMTDAQHLAWAS